MKDLTTGNPSKHLLMMALPIAVGLIVQALYYLVDLYFVSELGDAAVVGVSSIGNIAFLVIALVQMINVGAVALVSQAVGKKARDDANEVFNQALMMSLGAALIMLLAGFWVGTQYVYFVLNDSAAIEQGLTYLFWFLPNMALQFIVTAISAGLRGTGVVKPAMIAQLIGLVVNIVLAPILIRGWVTGHGFGVLGAGLSSSIAAVVGVAILVFHLTQRETYLVVALKRCKPLWHIWKKIVATGFPSAGEFLLMFIYSAAVYWAIQRFGVQAQAGFALGSRIMQSILVPALAIAFAMPALVGQNYGAALPSRVKRCFRQSMMILSGVMLMLGATCFTLSEALIRPFTEDPEVFQAGGDFLAIIALNFLPTGIVFACAGVFQGLGNTWPALISAGFRLLSFLLPVLWLAQQESFEMTQLWYVSAASVLIQAIISGLFVKREFQRKLDSPHAGANLNPMVNA